MANQRIKTGLYTTEVDEQGFVHQQPVYRFSGKSKVLKSIAFSDAVPPNNPIPHYTCIGCKQDKSTLTGSIRGRILRGYNVWMSDVRRWSLRSRPEPGTKPVPVYANGRLCAACSPSYKMSGDKPTKKGIIQFLKDDIQITPHTTITKDVVESEDFYEEVNKQLNSITTYDAGGIAISSRTITSSNKAVEKALNKLVPGLPKPKVTAKKITEVVCSYCEQHDGSNVPRCTACNRATCRKEQKLHLQGFRTFMSKRSGGRKSYDPITSKDDGIIVKAFYDPDINFDNIKKG